MTSPLPAAATVAIVGAGFCGTAVAVHLLDGLPPGARVLLLEQGPRFSRGLAYGTRSTSHWLNVPAGRLGLDPAHEGGFIDWLQARQSGYGPGQFVPRMMLGDYLAATLQDRAEAAQARGVTLERRHAEVVDWQRAGDTQVLRLADGSALRAEQVVLATGHVTLRAPSLPGATWGAPGLLADPWAPGALDELPENGELLVLGSGLTAVDMVTGLQDRGHLGTITLLSRRGLLPQPHRTLEARPRPGLSPVAELGEGWRLGDLVRALRRWSAEAQAEGRDWRDVMASVRGCTPALWRHLTLAERRQFLRHLVPWWDTHRHRLAPGIHRRLDAAMAAGQVLSAAGRVTAITPLPDGRWRVRWQPRSGGEPVQRDVSALLNCTGASTGLQHTTAPLLASLRNQGLLTPDALDLGLQVDAQHRPLDAHGEPAERLYYVGPMLKADCWEAIAIPELRVHAREVAQAVLAGVASAAQGKPSPRAACLNPPASAAA